MTTTEQMDTRINVSNSILNMIKNWESIPIDGERFFLITLEQKQEILKVIDVIENIPFKSMNKEEKIHYSWLINNADRIINCSRIVK